MMFSISFETMISIDFTDEVCRRRNVVFICRHCFVLSPHHLHARQMFRFKSIFRQDFLI